MVADVVGYSALMEADEANTLAAWRERRQTILRPVVKAHDGRVVKEMGDGVLVEFGSAVNAVNAAIKLQGKMKEANESLPEARRIVLRIGINLGDVIGEGSDIYGEGLNIAARLEVLAEPGGICVSGKVMEEVRGKTGMAFEDMGEHVLKNITAPVRTFRERIGEAAPLSSPAPVAPSKASIVVLPFSNMSGDPTQDYFADGITEDIITELARNSSLSVVARNSSFQFRGPGVDLAAVRRLLGVRYIVEGSIQKAGARIRVTAQLIDAVTGNHLWAERYDRTIEDVFAVPGRGGPDNCLDPRRPFGCQRRGTDTRQADDQLGGL
jgi:TolB-like protein